MKTFTKIFGIAGVLSMTAAVGAATRPNINTHAQFPDYAHQRIMAEGPSYGLTGRMSMSDKNDFRWVTETQSTTHHGLRVVYMREPVQSTHFENENWNSRHQMHQRSLPQDRAPGSTDYQENNPK